MEYSQLTDNASTRESFSNMNHLHNINSSTTSFHLHHQHGRGDHHHHHHHHSSGLVISSSGGLVKSEANSSSQRAVHHQEFHHPVLLERSHHHQTLHHHLQQQQQQQQPHDVNDAIKAKIIAHPQYPNLLDAYMDCQKVGAPAEVVNRLTAVRRELEMRNKSPATSRSSSDGQTDPELDQFMEAYCDMLVKYREELARPLQEAMEFMRRIESQLRTLTDGPIRILSVEKSEGVGSSEDDQNNSGGEMELPEIDPRAEDRELKNHLLKKYSGYLSSLKQELSKKKKKGKLPKEARQKLLNWWELHYKWPYPSETEKVALAESTGLDQKQINNWFINQRKRHWKPSEDMQFVVMDGLHPQNAAALYMDGHFMGEDHYRLGP
ncbi:hypothetical protein Syun_004466 [Stephania yunnanensis]|uniref:Uncharacterized protein n=1 Tax=Stephania yunnanensis TaxID=152371 RepID=A0AAP0L6E0_9MAGN